MARQETQQYSVAIIRKNLNMLLLIALLSLQYNITYIIIHLFFDKI